MQRSPAYLLVFHGSSDPRPLTAANTLARFFSERICHTDPGIPLSQSANGISHLSDVESIISPTNRATLMAASEQSQPSICVAALEGDALPLHEQIHRFGQTLLSTENSGCSEPIRLLVLPLFLLPGVHVMQDIPTEIEIAQKAIGQNVQIELMPHLGSHPKLYRLLAERLSALPVEASVLLAHGSRRVGANQPTETLAENLGAVTAYWSITPTLESRLQELNNLGLRKIAILPYFLFTGSTTDAITQTVDRLSQQFPALDLLLTPPLEAYPEVADLLVDLAIGKRKG